MSKSRVHHYFNTQITLLALLVACTGGTNDPLDNDGQPSPIVAATATRAIVPATSTAQPTKINIPASPTLPSSPTPSPTPSITTPPLPTLSPNDEEAELLRLIATNNNCKLPCWWGIVPGASQPSDLLGFLNPLGINNFGPPRLWSDGAKYYNYAFEVNQVESLNLTMAFSERDNIIQDIAITAFNFRIFPKYARAFQNYSLSKILTSYKVPSRVLMGFQPPAEPNAGFTYDVWLFYEQSGILIEYVGDGVTPIGDSIEICPTDESILEMRLFLQSPTSTQPLDQITKGYIDFESFISRGYLRSIEDAISSDLNEFQETFANQPDACFLSPASIW